MNELLDIFFGLDHHSHNYVLFFQQVSKNHNAWLIFWQKLILSRVTGGVNLQLIQCNDKKWKWIQVHPTPASSLLPTKIFYLFRSSFQSDHDDATTTDWVSMSHAAENIWVSATSKSFVFYPKHEFFIKYSQRAPIGSKYW